MTTNVIENTFKDLDKAWTRNNIDWLLTRNLSDDYNADDIDILVKENDFIQAINELNRIGYISSSHDEALGGRMKGYQMNLVKKNRVKIDLHKDFTWRKSKYIDLDFIWNLTQKDEIYGVNFLRPNKQIDAFLILINILFEKTYLHQSDKEVLKYIKVLRNTKFIEQSQKYGWDNSARSLSNWLNTEHINSYPKFLPFTLIIYTYFEKLIFEKRIDLISLLYYLFFRFRFTLKGRLPY